MQKIRIAYLTIILGLALGTSYLIDWNTGFEPGYDEGVSDIALGQIKPHDYFIKRGILRETRKRH